MPMAIIAEIARIQGFAGEQALGWSGRSTNAFLLVAAAEYGLAHCIREVAAIGAGSLHRLPTPFCPNRCFDFHLNPAALHSDFRGLRQMVSFGGMSPPRSLS